MLGRSSACFVFGVAAFLLLAVATLSVGLSFETSASSPSLASTVSITDLDAWCTGPGVSWNSSESTCTVAGNVTMFGDVAVQVEDLRIAGSGALYIESGASLEIRAGGVVTVWTTAIDGVIVEDGGAISNSGLIRVRSPAMGNGILNKGNLTNQGSITIENSGNFQSPNSGIYNEGAISNSGAMEIEGPGYEGIGVRNQGYIANSGTITVENSGNGSVGIFMPNKGSTISNTGTIAIENLGLLSYGIYDWESVIANAGNVSIENGNGGSGIFLSALGQGNITDTCTGTFAVRGEGSTEGLTLPVPVIGSCTKASSATTDLYVVVGAAAGLAVVSSVVFMRGRRKPPQT